METEPFQDLMLFDKSTGVAAKGALADRRTQLLGWILDNSQTTDCRHLRNYEPQMDGTYGVSKPQNPALKVEICSLLAFNTVTGAANIFEPHQKLSPSASTETLTLSKLQEGCFAKTSSEGSNRAKSSTGSEGTSLLLQSPEAQAHAHAIRNLELKLAKRRGDRAIASYKAKKSRAASARSVSDPKQDQGLSLKTQFSDMAGTSATGNCRMHSDDTTKFKRLLKNRASAQKARDRKKQMVENMMQIIQHSQQHISDLEKKILAMRRKIPRCD